jgi:glycosyltransferase involved in cell wall biosynthesis
LAFCSEFRNFQEIFLSRKQPREADKQTEACLQIVVVSPFLDRRHGTERCIIEQIERLSSKYGWGIHLFSQHVENIHGLLTETPKSSATGFICWHKVSDIPGPHLLKFLWWFFANRSARKRALKRLEERSLLIYSPGINCLDADAITVHIVFHEFYARVRDELTLLKVPVSKWPVTLHRKLYYKLIMALERRIYTNPRVHLAAVSNLVSSQLEKHFGRTDSVVIPNAVDTLIFNSEARLARRSVSRQNLKLDSSDFVVLLIGNDWKKKGLDQLLRALAVIQIPIRLLVVGKDDPGLYRSVLQQLRLEDRVRFLAPSADVLSFYAATDAYVAPSLEDAFGLPILEAMACGLPVIASVQAGASENIIDGTTGYLLRDPMNHVELAELIRRVAGDRAAAHKLGAAAAQHVQASVAWDHNVSATREFLGNALASRQI